MGQRAAKVAAYGGSDLASPGGEGGCAFLDVSILRLLILKDPIMDLLSHAEMGKRGYALSLYPTSVCARERERRRFPGFRVWQGCAGEAALLLYLLLLSSSNIVVCCKCIGHLGLKQRSSGNLSTNLVWVPGCGEIWIEVDFMRFQVLLKTFQPALVRSCCFFGFLPLICLWYF